jgi:hypothetical protein
MMNEERWLPIPGFEGSYEVSDQGRVKSLNRIVACCGPIKGAYPSTKKGRVLAPGSMPGGHLSVSLGWGFGSRCVHELVLLAFTGPAPPKTEARHRDGDPTNNRLANLSWGTRGDNIRDKKWHKGQSTYKLGPCDVYFIKTALKYKTVKRSELTRIFNISISAVDKIRSLVYHTDIDVK